MALDTFKPYLFVSAGEQSNKLLTPTYSGGIASFQAQRAQALSKLLVQLSPVQDLNGQPAPYPPGGGKNKLPYPYTQTTKTENGVTFTDNGDGSISLSGTATEQTDFILETSATGVLPAETAVIVSGGYSDNIFVRCAIDGQTPTSRGSDASVTTTDGDFTGNCYIRVESGTNCDNVKVYPMIRLASVSDATFAPYSNICPITGHDDMTVMVVNSNQLDFGTGTDRTSNGVTAHYEGSTVKLSGTATGSAWTTLYNRPVTLKPGTYYLLTSGDAKIVNQYLQVNYADGTNIIVRGFTGGEFVSPVEFVIDKEVATITYAINVANGVKSDGTIYAAIATSSGATWTEAASRKYEISWQTEAGTVYGGTLDAVSGVLTVTHALWTDNGTAPWSMTGTGQFYVWQSFVTNAVYTEDGCACNYAKYKNDYSGFTAFVRTANNTVTLGDGWGTLYDSVEDLKAAFAQTPLQIVYKLATPETYQLDPEDIMTLPGYNQIYTDAGPVLDVEF